MHERMAAAATAAAAEALLQSASPTRASAQATPVPSTPLSSASAASSASPSLDRTPSSILLFVDIALGETTERIIVYRGVPTSQLAAEFTKQHKLDPAYDDVIKDMLDQQILALQQ
jgi:hypothetical protein